MNDHDGLIASPPSSSSSLSEVPLKSSPESPSEELSELSDDELSDELCDEVSPLSAGAGAGAGAGAETLGDPTLTDGVGATLIFAALNAFGILTLAILGGLMFATA